QRGGLLPPGRALPGHPAARGGGVLLARHLPRPRARRCPQLPGAGEGPHRRPRRRQPAARARPPRPAAQGGGQVSAVDRGAPAPAATSALPGGATAPFDADETCWNTIGVWGDRTPRCERLPEVIHCQNCEVYCKAGRGLLERLPSQEYLREWQQELA